jgi:hypothetical protein
MGENIGLRVSARLLKSVSCQIPLPTYKLPLCYVFNIDLNWPSEKWFEESLKNKAPAALPHLLFYPARSAH